MNTTELVLDPLHRVSVKMTWGDGRHTMTMPPVYSGPFHVMDFVVSTNHPDKYSIQVIADWEPRG